MVIFSKAIFLHRHHKKTKANNIYMQYLSRKTEKDEKSAVQLIVQFCTDGSSDFE